MQHIFAVTRDLIKIARRHKYLLCQMVPAMHMVATSHFRYSAPLVPWRDAERQDARGMDAGSKGCLEAAPWLRLGTPYVPQREETRFFR